MAIVRDNPSELRYELVEEGTIIGEIRYRRAPGAIALVHTDVAPAYEGRGYASQLIEAALHDLRARDLAVIPICPLVRDWIDKHAEFELPLVAEDLQEE